MEGKSGVSDAQVSVDLCGGATERALDCHARALRSDMCVAEIVRMTSCGGTTTIYRVAVFSESCHGKHLMGADQILMCASHCFDELTSSSCIVVPWACVSRRRLRHLFLAR